MGIKNSIFDLSGKTALITGGGSGLGRAFCEAMAEFGADVSLTGRTEEKLNETVRQIAKYGHGTLAVKADVSREDEIKMLVEKTINKFGRLDIVFCNATDRINFYNIHEMPVDDWDKVMALDLRGVFLLIRAVLPQMMKQKSGSIIIMNAIGGLTAGGGKTISKMSHYASAKAGLVGLTKHAAVEYGKYGIRVNAIAPGMHLTDLFSNPDEGMKKVIQMHIDNTPLGRVGVPDDIKGIALWLASDASSFVTGQTITQDGGMTA
jgi:NAD(P)-dependent dehydrogenase (short-subunit alcohol dehydrogenase family)